MNITGNMENRRENDKEKLFLLEFLHYPPLVVCESDFLGFPTNHMNTNHITFQSGKSCFFSLRVPKGPVLPTPFDIKVSIIYKMKENVLPDKLEIGKTSIDMGDSFTQLLNTNTDENCDRLPLSKSITGTFDIKDEAGKTIGSLASFIRLSCFGKLIITQFSLNKDDEKSYLFKGTDVKQFCRDGESVHGKIEENKSFCGVKDSGKYNEPPFSNKTGHGDEVELFESKQRKNNIPSQSKPFDRMETKPYGYEGQRQVNPALIPSGAYPMTQYQQYPIPPNNLCDCPYSRPQNATSRKTPKTDVNMSLEPGEVGLQEDQVIFQLPLKRPGDPITNRDRDADSSIYYKLTSAEQTSEGQQKNTVQIKSDDLPGMAGKSIVGPVSGLPVDDGHDVFLLKIGKKCDGDKKRNLELELRTPKLKEPKPPMTDRNTQYLESDIPSDGGGKKDSKKKGSKGKGKGKKGKK